MYFVINNKYNWDRDYFIAKVISVARQRIAIYKVGATELALDQYLQKECHKSLKTICKELLFATKFYKNDDTYIVKFANKDIENLATFITYGNGKIYGSKILQVAFAWNI